MKENKQDLENSEKKYSLDDFEEDDGLICVLCGEPWIPSFKNRCECGGFCTWGYEVDGEMLSWEDYEKRIPKPPPDENILF